MLLILGGNGVKRRGVLGQLPFRIQTGLGNHLRRNEHLALIGNIHRELHLRVATAIHYTVVTTGTTTTRGATPADKTITTALLTAPLATFAASLTTTATSATGQVGVIRGRAELTDVVKRLVQREKLGRGNKVGRKNRRLLDGARVRTKVQTTSVLSCVVCRKLLALG
jgi:hypothetical protein